MTYDFERQLAIGKKGEAKVCEWLSQEWQLVHATVPQEIEQGIDYLGFHKTSGEKRTFEVKTDINKSGRTFIETIKNDVTNAPGWAHTCAADRLIYYLPNFLGKLLEIQPNVIRENLPFWTKKFRLASAQNKGYKTVGILVPVAELELVSEQYPVVVLSGGLDV